MLPAGRIAVATVAAVALAGCGSSSSSFTLDASRSCLSDLGETKPQSDLDYIIQDASAGAIGVNVQGTEVAVAFHNSVNDAKRTEASISLLAKGLDMPVDDILHWQQNVVVEWDETPSDAQQSLVEGCLR